MASTSKSSRSRNNSKKNFRLDPEARARIEAEYSAVADDYSNYDIPEKPKKKRVWLRKLIVRVVLLSIAVIMVNIAILFFTGQLWFNEPRKRDYPVRGPVITEKQGKVNWEKFAAQNIQMAYIRATKSTAYVDESFRKNKSGSAETALPVGMLHIFDISMDGKEQAEHFIKTVGGQRGNLIPAVEVGYTGFYRVLPPDDEDVAQRLRAFADCIISEYGVSPVIKCSEKTYSRLLDSHGFDDCYIWIESEYSKVDESIEWDFWGYSSRVKFEYYEDKGFLEMVLFKGSEEEFEEYFVVQ